MPAGYHHDSRIRLGPFISGAIVFGLPYSISISVAVDSNYAPDRYLLLPIFGPLISAASRPNDDSSSTAKTFLTFDFLMQTTGAVLLIVGIALPHHLFVRDDAPSSAGGVPFTWTIGPRAFEHQGGGLGAFGTFLACRAGAASFQNLALRRLARQGRGMGCILPPPSTAPEQGSLLERYWACIAMQEQLAILATSERDVPAVGRETGGMAGLRLSPFDPCDEAPTLRPAAPPTLRADAAD